MREIHGQRSNSRPCKYAEFAAELTDALMWNRGPIGGPFDLIDRNGQHHTDAEFRGMLSTLGAIAIGASEYYPYAYVSAPEPCCEGLTEDDCQLMWEQVETLEGDAIDQCVAYCPWQ